MINPVKVGIYVLLACAALWFGTRFYSEFKKRSDTTTAVLPGDTNEVAQAASAAIPPTNEVPANVTNETVQTTNAVPDANAIASAPTNEVPSQAASNDVTAASANEAPAQTAQSFSKGKWMANMGAFLGLLIILGLMAAYDVTQFLGNRSVDFLFNDDLKGVHNPEYEEAEALWTNGKPLDAIQAMREYLKKNPREQYVALRIAEIYEKDLGNYLAAALEYEQVLTHKLPRERWGWAAIHLCNLYSKMGKQDKCVAMLRRVESEYAETAAAKKARKRLAMFESEGDTNALGLDMPEDPNAADSETPEPVPKVESKKKVEEPASNLPPGFRPKK